MDDATVDRLARDLAEALKGGAVDEMGWVADDVWEFDAEIQLAVDGDVNLRALARAAIRSLVAAGFTPPT